MLRGSKTHATVVDHGDLAPGNMMVHPGHKGVTGIIDWGNSWLCSRRMGEDQGLTLNGLM
ncbi:hypothetical protein SAMD00023353_2500460 [Rosellinia necatrix]|uniref:Aminoglycoside phosphotransferase domain-containing protein n=1 Tax=Rosellinia necatrix TaxID=77044 RepID=A0A1S8A809_ROSNE|nr:hypothetical protein SAMD00023353_2500460 [Rosellinia necatrix]